MFLIMIVLSNCSTSWCQSNQPSYHLSSTGGQEQSDSLVLVPVDALRSANAKMVELEFEKQINTKLNAIVANDSIIISQLNNNIIVLNKQYSNKIYKVKKQRNVWFCTTAGCSLLLILSLL